MDKCQHLVAKTTFCPHCGKLLKENPLDGLMLHVNKLTGQKERRYNTRLQWYRTNSPKEIGSKKKWEESLESEIRLLRKWEAWQKALSDVISIMGKGKPK